MKFRHEEWRRLYVRERGAFASLPWIARAAACQLLKACDDTGRIHVGKKTLAAVVAFQMGGNRNDRRLMGGVFKLLFAEGYLLQTDEYVVIRNYVEAQRHSNKTGPVQSTKFRHEKWRKLYVHEQGAFANLPWFARAAASYLVKVCDDQGCIYVGRKPLDAVVAFQMGATPIDRRLMRTLFPLLFAEGYLVQHADHVVIRNYLDAQRRGDVDDEVSTSAAMSRPTVSEPRADREPTVSEPRADREPTVSEPRADREPTVTDDLSARNHSTDDASARARAFSSVPCPSVPSSVVSKEEEKACALSDSLAKQEAGSDPAPAPEPAPKAAFALTHPGLPLLPDDVPVAPIDPVVEVFAYWQQVMTSPRSELTPNRRKKISARLKEKYSVEQLCDAIFGCRKSPWHMGEEAKTGGKTQNDIEVICRDSAQIEKFIKIAAPHKGRSHADVRASRRIMREADAEIKNTTMSNEAWDSATQKLKTGLLKIGEEQALAVKLEKERQLESDRRWGEAATEPSEATG